MATATHTDDPNAASAPRPDEPRTPSKHAKAEHEKETAEQTAARQLATGLADPLAPTPRTDLEHYTITYDAHCAEILGIGHPIGGADLYELTMRNHDGELITITVPRTFEEASTFMPGSFYCEPLLDGQPVKPVTVFAASVFHRLTNTTPEQVRKAAEAKQADHAKHSSPGPQPQGAQSHQEPKPDTSKVGHPNSLKK